MYTATYIHKSIRCVYNVPALVLALMQGDSFATVSIKNYAALGAYTIPVSVGRITERIPLLILVRKRYYFRRRILDCWCAGASCLYFLHCG
jgi:hypothetical protein